MKKLLTLIALLISLPVLAEESAYMKGYNDYMALSDRSDRIHRDSMDEINRINDQVQRDDEAKTNRAARDFYERDREENLYGGYYGSSRSRR